jgi:hypothetical protein
VQAPAWHVSVWVQALSSVQLEPSVLTGSEHAPDDGLQVPTSWHEFEAVHVTGFVPVQVPDWQVSTCVQALSSLQVLPVAGPQSPFVAAPAAVEQAWQSLVPPEQGPLQQTPSTQLPLAQLLGAEQPAPLARRAS